MNSVIAGLCWKPLRKSLPHLRQTDFISQGTRFVNSPCGSLGMVNVFCAVIPLSLHPFLRLIADVNATIRRSSAHSHTRPCVTSLMQPAPHILTSLSLNCGLCLCLSLFLSISSHPCTRTPALFSLHLCAISRTVYYVVARRNSFLWVPRQAHNVLLYSNDYLGHRWQPHQGHLDSLRYSKFIVVITIIHWERIKSSLLWLLSLILNILESTPFNNKYLYGQWICWTIVVWLLDFVSACRDLKRRCLNKTAFQSLLSEPFPTRIGSFFQLNKLSSSPRSFQ